MRFVRAVVALVAMMLAVSGASVGQTTVAQQGTPEDEGSNGVIEIHGRICEEIPADDAWYDTCHDSPLSGQVFTVINTQTQETIEGTSDDAGNIVLEVPPGEYRVAGPPDDQVEESFIYCSAGDGGPQVPHPAIIDAEQPYLVCDYYVVPGGSQGEIPVDVMVNLCVAPGCTELPEAVEPADGVEVTVTSRDTGDELGSCVSGEVEPGNCVIGMTDLPQTVNVTVTEETIPEGWIVDSNPQRYEIQPDQATIWLLLYAEDTEDTPPSDESDPVPLPMPIALELPASLYNGTCADLNASTSAEPLDALILVEGDLTGSPDAIETATGYTEVAMTVSELLDGQYAIAVMDEQQSVIACGDVGGVLDQDGSFAIGLAPVNDSSAAGTAYFAPRAGGSTTGLSTFLSPEGLIPATDDLATPGA